MRTTLRRLTLVLTATPLLLGVLALAGPVEAARPGDPNCRRACPPTKKLNGFTCVFVGCDAVSGDCLYGC